MIIPENRSFFFKFNLPFLQWHLLMIITAIGIDYFLRRLIWVDVIRYLGFTGTLAIIVSLYYSLRKRRIIKTGSPRQLLLPHESHHNHNNVQQMKSIIILGVLVVFSWFAYMHPIL